METLESIIDASALQLFEKEVLKDAFSNLNEGEKESLVTIFSARPQLVPILYINLVAKTIATSKKDATAFDRIVKEEIELLESLQD